MIGGTGENTAALISGVFTLWQKIAQLGFFNAQNMFLFFRKH
jgi:hypothetical protein